MIHWLRVKGLTASILVIATTLTACAGSRDQGAADGPTARQVTAASQCGFTEPGLLYMDSRQRLEEVTGARGMNLTAMEDHDFSNEHLLLVAAGRKPTGGYGVALDSSRLEGGVLKLTMTLRTPSPDQMVTQALTSPCAVVAVIAEGWETVHVTGPGLPDLSLER
ncbi:protease complex subunit PrcB family protein [Marinobacter segnicrescens]|uniref:protease complex subunit PrcB family protein n=1 Tax=Marinobacter segnicrescens TaxID=430453 RepID=UPI003A8D5F7A